MRDLVLDYDGRVNCHRAELDLYNPSFDLTLVKVAARCQDVASFDMHGREFCEALMELSDSNPECPLIMMSLKKFNKSLLESLLTEARTKPTVGVLRALKEAVDALPFALWDTFPLNSIFDIGLPPMRGVAQLLNIENPLSVDGAELFRNRYLFSVSLPASHDSLFHGTTRDGKAIREDGGCEQEQERNSVPDMTDSRVPWRWGCSRRYLDVSGEAEKLGPSKEAQIREKLPFSYSAAAMQLAKEFNLGEC